MIGCPCGGFTVRTTEKRGELLLRYECCGACGRCGQWVLRKNGEIVARGERARREYRENAAHLKVVK